MVSARDRQLSAALIAVAASSASPRASVRVGIGRPALVVEETASSPPAGVLEEGARVPLSPRHALALGELATVG